MKLTVLGVGGAGCRLADHLQRAETDDRPFLVGVRAFDAARSTFETLDLPDEHCRAFRPVQSGSNANTEAAGDDDQSHVGDDTDSDDQSDGSVTFETRPEPYEHNLPTMREAAESSIAELRRVASDAITGETDGVLVCAGLGGATGAGATPVIVDALRSIHDLPVFSVSVLPAESEGEEAAENAAAGLRALESSVDSQLLFDNSLLAKGVEPPEHPQDASDAYHDTNEKIATWVAMLFDAGESSSTAVVGEKVLDTADLCATLGESGYTMLGYRREQVKEKQSLVGRLLGRGGDDEVDSVASYSTIETAVRRALLRHRSFEADDDLPSTERALLLAVGPPEWLDRGALADGRGLLTQRTDGAIVRGADAPDPEGTDLQLLVVCAGMPRPNRVRELLASH